MFNQETAKHRRACSRKELLFLEDSHCDVRESGSISVNGRSTRTCGVELEPHEHRSFAGRLNRSGGTQLRLCGL